MMNNSAPGDNSPERLRFWRNGIRRWISQSSKTFAKSSKQQNKKTVDQKQKEGSILL